MTPEQRIAQLAEERGGSVTTPPRPAVVSARRQTKEPIRRIAGADRRLPMTWQGMRDTWDDSNNRKLLMRLETRLAAGVIVRCLGDGWSIAHDRNDNDRSGCRVVHRDGYGFRLSREWRDPARFAVSALECYRRDDCPSITVSASRPLGDIAADIQRRLIDNGLRESYAKQKQFDESEREKMRERVNRVERVARAFGGVLRNIRHWRSSGYPEASTPFGMVKLGYSLHGPDIQLELSVSQELAELIGKTASQRKENQCTTKANI